MDVVITSGMLNVLMALGMTLSLVFVHYFFGKYKQARKEEKQAEKEKKENRKDIKSIQ